MTALVTAFVLGPVVTSVRLGTYASSWETWAYPWRLVLMVPFGAQLPGVFDDNLYAGAVNGSLWSLPLEVLAYAAVAVLGMTGVLARRWVVSALALASLLWAAWWEPVMSEAVGSAYVLSAFAVGAAAYSWRARIVLSTPVATAALIVCVLTGYGPAPLRVVTWTLAAVYLSYWFAYAVPRTARMPDPVRGHVVRPLHLGLPGPADDRHDRRRRCGPVAGRRHRDAGRVAAGPGVVATRRATGAAPEASAHAGRTDRCRDTGVVGG